VSCEDEFNDDYWFRDGDYSEPLGKMGCLFPGQCCMPGFHYESECHTPDMLMSQMNEEPTTPPATVPREEFQKAVDVVRAIWQQLDAMIEPGTLAADGYVVSGAALEAARKLANDFLSRHHPNQKDV
jgi:hypothetical protein